nr:T9SS type A sorting domain-containing protein [Chitinophagales bacterium]
AAVQVFPNPTNEVLYLSGIENARVQIFYLAGKLLLNLPSVNNQINVKNLPNGIYTIQISNQNQATACKFVKQ